MIDILFKFGNDVILVKIDGANLSFGNTSQGAMMATIDGMKLNKDGVMKEHPDLLYAEDWREQAITRFKFKLKEMANENEICEYVIKELGQFGYIPYKKQIKGMRVVNL